MGSTSDYVPAAPSAYPLRLVTALGITCTTPPFWVSLPYGVTREVPGYACIRTRPRHAASVRARPSNSLMTPVWSGCTRALPRTSCLVWWWWKDTVPGRSISRAAAQRALL